MRFLLQAIAAASGFWLASRIIHGVHVRGYVTLLEAGVILGLLNAIVRPILILLTIPLTLITLGLFLLVINGVTVWITAGLLSGLQIDGLTPAVLTALVITAVSWLARAVFLEA